MSSLVSGDSIRKSPKSSRNRKPSATFLTRLLHVRTGLRAGGIFVNHTRAVMRIGRPRIDAAARAAVAAHFEAKRRLRLADMRLRARAGVIAGRA